MNHQSRFDAGYRMLGAGALGWPRGMVRGGFRMESTCTPMVDSCWCMAKPIQYCKVKKKLNKKKELEKYVVFPARKKIVLNACCHFSRVWLSATPWTVACHVPLSMGILQVRILEWATVPSFRGSSQPRDQTCISLVHLLHRQEGSLPLAPQGRSEKWPKAGVRC